MTITERNPATTPDDVLLLIFILLSMKDLRAVSMVCRSWSTLAVDTLWRQHQVPLSAVAAKLPMFASTTEGMKDVRCTMLDSAHQQEWADFNYRFANKITHLHFDEALKEGLSKSLSKVLEAGIDGPSSLFPNLRKLTISADAAQCEVNLNFDLTFKLLVTTSLIFVDIQNHQIRQLQRIPSILQTLLDSTRHLRTLRIFQNSLNGMETIQAPAEGFGAFLELRILHLSDLTFPGWRSLEECPKLEEIELHYYGYKGAGEEGELDSGIVLKRLHTFHLSVRAKSSFPRRFIQPIMMRTSMPSLRVLQLPLTCSWRWIRMIIERLQESSPLLEHLALDHHCKETWSLVELLRPFSRLDCLVLVPLGNTGPFDNKHMEHISRELPRLRRIAFMTIGSGTTPMLTEGVLISLARYSLALEDLRIDLDLINFERPESITPHTSLRKLRVRAVNLSQGAIQPFASFLSELFPNITASTFSIAIKPHDGDEGVESRVALKKAFINAKSSAALG
ncbi:hypothetical protein FRB93_002814 [Tulasnella sp. JGI-2019a]|nr:hypothetical protein FRB93_002814 [Tulasnella sp. JGI-2019a]